jgi:hypothetical protein
MILVLTFGLIGTLVVISPSTQPVHAASSLTGGPGEAWTSAIYGPEPSSLPSLENSWTSYYSQSDFQTYQAEFGWNEIRLFFCFTNMASYTSNPDCLYWQVNAHSTSGSSPDLSWLGAVVSMANTQGLRVDLTDMDFTGQAPVAGAMATWISDWTAMATYFSGNSGIAVFQFANEFEHSTTTNGNLTAAMTAIRSVDPTVTLAMWNYSPSTSSGGSTYPGAPQFTVPSNVWNSIHVSTYTFNDAREYTGCQTESFLLNEFDTAENYAANYGIPYYAGEINGQYSACNSVTEYFLNLLIANHVPYILMGYSVNRANWDAILSSIASPTSTTSSTKSLSSSSTTSSISPPSSSTSTTTSTSKSSTTTSTSSTTSTTKSSTTTSTAPSTTTTSTSTSTSTSHTTSSSTTTTTTTSSTTSTTTSHTTTETSTTQTASPTTTTTTTTKTTTSTTTTTSAPSTTTTSEPTTTTTSTSSTTTTSTSTSTSQIAPTTTTTTTTTTTSPPSTTTAMTSSTQSTSTSTSSTGSSVSSSTSASNDSVSTQHTAPGTGYTDYGNPHGSSSYSTSTTTIYLPTGQTQGTGSSVGQNSYQDEFSSFMALALTRSNIPIFLGLAGLSGLVVGLRRVHHKSPE